MQQERQLEGMTNKELFALYHDTGDAQVKQELTLRYLYVVKNIVLQMYPAFAKYMELEDLVSEGVLVVMRGIDRYDMSRNSSFETYITARIRGKVFDLFYKSGYLSKYMYKRIRAFDMAQDKLREELGRQPSNEELADSLQIDLKRLQNIQKGKDMHKMLSLDMLLEEAQATGSEQPVNHEPGTRPEDAYLWLEEKKALAQAVEQLGKNEKLVISLHYVENLKIKEIALLMNRTQSRISQIHREAISKLRVAMEKYYNT